MPDAVVAVRSSSASLWRGRQQDALEVPLLTEYARDSWAAVSVTEERSANESRDRLYPTVEAQKRR
jgi:hypothetical protein